jgi:hypothetical protein
MNTEKKVYVIRQVHFDELDNKYIEVGLGEIHSAYTDYEKAYQTYIALEKKAFSQEYLDQYITRNYEGESIEDKLVHFFESNFQLDVLARDVAMSLPKNATEAQLKQLMHIMHIHFYNISVYDKVPTFYRAKINEEVWEDLYAHHGFGRLPVDTPQETYREALELGLWCMEHDLEGVFDAITPDIYIGTLDEIAEDAEEMEAYLQKCRVLYYSERGERLAKRGNRREDWLYEELEGLLPLLKNRPFTIEKVKLEIKA